MKISRPGRFALTTLSLFATGLSPVLAQDGPGLVGTFRFSQGLEVSDNPDLMTSSPGTTFTSVTGLGFSLDSETRNQRFNFSLGTDLEGRFGEGASAADDFETTNNRVGVSYDREGANSSLSLGADYSEINLRDQTVGFFVDDEFDPDALVIDGGSRERRDIRARLRTGIEGPFGLDVSARHTSFDYKDTTDPDLEDSDTLRVDGTAYFRINPAMTARVIAGLSERDEVDATSTERRDSYVGVGLEGELASGVRYDAALTVDDSEVRELGVVTTSEDGVGVSLGATFDRPDGELGIDVSSRVDETGRRTTAQVRRSFDLPQGGLSLSLGVVDQEDDGTEFIASLSYERELPTGMLEASLVQRPGTDDGSPVVNTSLSVNYRQQINEVSSWDAGFSFGESSGFGASGGDSSATATFAYNRELTEEWSLRAGVELQRVNDSGADRDSNTVFVTVGRDFSFGF